MVNLFALNYAIKSINRRKKKQLGVTLAVALGVTLMVGVQIGSSGLENALASQLWSAAGSTDAHIWDPVNTYIPGNLSDYVYSLNLQQLEVAESRISYTLPVYSNKDGQFDPNINFYGIQTSTASHFGSFYDLNGDKIDINGLNSQNSVLISDIVAKSLNLKVGDVITTIVPDGLGNSNATEYTVYQVYNSQKGRGLENNYDDTPIVYVNLESFQHYLAPELSGAITGLALKFNSVNRNLEDIDIKGKNFDGKSIIESALKVLETSFESANLPYKANSYRVDIINTIKESISGIRAVLNLFVIMLNGTALLLIINVQSMSLDDRKYQTAVLRAMGSNKAQVFKVFIIESGLIGIAGALAGVAFGLFYGQWIQKFIGNIFGINAASFTVVTTPMIVSALIMGILLSILTAVAPAWFAASRSITNELRGVEEAKVAKKSRKAFVFGLTLTITGLMAAQNVGDFWTKAAWKSFDDQTSIMFAFGLTLAGIGLLLSYVIPRKIALNISGLAFYGLALFVMNVGIDWAEEGNGNNWFTVNLVFIVIGLVLLVAVNFEYLMFGLNRVLSKVPAFRAISLVSTRGMIGKKNRLSMVYAIFVVILILNVFLVSAAQTIREGNVNSYETKSQGVDLVINSNVANDQIASTIASIPNVEHVYAFRSYFGPLYLQNPLSPDFKAETDLDFRRIVEVPQEVINPQSNYQSADALPFSFFTGNSEFGYASPSKMTNDQQIDLSSQILGDFYAGKIAEHPNRISLDGNVTNIVEKQVMVIGDYFTDKWMGMDNLYFTTGDPQNPVLSTYNPVSAFTMMGDWNFLSGALIVTPDTAALLPGFKTVNAPNLFLVKTSYQYAQDKSLDKLAGQIESRINDLADPSSLSSQVGTLIGASARVVHEEVYDYFKVDAQFWDFLGSFTMLGLIIGAAGMVIIAARSVSERTREIGMMRAIGFKQSSVVFSIGVELLFITLLGLFTGIANGILFTEVFAKFALNTGTNYPIGKIALYSGIIFFISVFAGIIPGIRASRVPPSQALRYSG